MCVCVCVHEPHRGIVRVHVFLVSFVFLQTFYLGLSVPVYFYCILLYIFSNILARVIFLGGCFRYLCMLVLTGSCDFTLR